MNKNRLFLIVIWALILAGCQSTIDKSPVVLPSPSVTQGMKITNSETPAESKLTETPEMIPASTITFEPTPSDIQSIACGEIFCHVEWAGKLERPISAEFRNIIDPSYPYASTRNKTLEPHHGVELINSSGTPVLAAQTGKVIYAGRDDLTLLGPYTSFYGNVIILKHPGLYQGRDIYTVYGHLSVLYVEEGEWVEIGDEIGKVGATGAADGSHLHFEVRLDVNDYAYTTNPVIWFSPITQPEKQLSSLLTGLILDQYGNAVSEFQMSLEKFNAEGEIEAYYYPVTYYPVGVNSHPVLNENFSVPDLPPGDYRLAFVYGKLYEVFFTLEPGELGFIFLQLN